MGMAFEGTNDKNVNFNIGILSGDSNVTDASYVTEDSRTAVRIYCENGGWNPRFHALAETPFDPEEYTLVQYVYKAAQGQNTAGTDITGSSARLLYWTSAETNGFYTDGEHKIGGDIGIAVDNAWKTLTYDMSDAANGLAAHPWNKTGGIYGISASPLRAPALAVSYIDAIRVYRKGVVTVTYDTNAPEGAAVLQTVEADTNRDVGTGYYLSKQYAGRGRLSFCRLGINAGRFRTRNGKHNRFDRRYDGLCRMGPRPCTAHLRQDLHPHKRRNGHPL